MKSEWQSWIQIIVILHSWFGVSNGFGLFLKTHLRPLLPVRTMRPQKHYYLLVKAIPRMHLPDYKPYGHQEHKDFLTHLEPTPAVVNPVLDEIAVSFDEEAIIDHFVITHHIIRTRKKGHIYGHHLRHPYGYRFKRRPTRKYPRTRPHHTDKTDRQACHSDWKTCKMGRHFPVREKSGNFEQTRKVGEITQNTGKFREFQTNIVCYF